MKTKILLALIFSSIFLIGCFDANNDKDDSKIETRYIEKQFPFSSLFHIEEVGVNVWIREPKNIMTVHETFKLGFYKGFIMEEKINDYSFSFAWFQSKTSLKTKMDSLIITYEQPDSGIKYYQEFWQRREAEGNDSIVFLVLSEVSAIYNNNAVGKRSEYVDPILKNLLDIKIEQEQPITQGKALVHFEYMKELGIYESAHNLLYENYLYDDITLDRYELEKTLKKEHIVYDTITIWRYPFIQDNTK